MCFSIIENTYGKYSWFILPIYKIVSMTHRFQFFGSPSDIRSSSSQTSFVSCKIAIQSLSTGFAPVLKYYLLLFSFVGVLHLYAIVRFLTLSHLFFFFLCQSCLQLFFLAFTRENRSGWMAEREMSIFTCAPIFTYTQQNENFPNFRLSITGENIIRRSRINFPLAYYKLQLLSIILVMRMWRDRAAEG